MHMPDATNGSSPNGAVVAQHAVTFAAGLACEGMIPFAAIYSSFLQRGYDQIVHDVCLQSLPGVGHPADADCEVTSCQCNALSVSTAALLSIHQLARWACMS